MRPASRAEIFLSHSSIDTNILSADPFSLIRSQKYIYRRSLTRLTYPVESRQRSLTGNHFGSFTLRIQFCIGSTRSYRAKPDSTSCGFLGSNPRDLLGRAHA